MWVSIGLYLSLPKQLFLTLKMSYLAILIGFKYESNILDGTLIDLRNMRDLFTQGNGYCVILSDIDKKESQIQSSHILIKTKQNIEDAIEGLNIHTETRLVVYYTGHGDENSKMRLPDGTNFSLQEFKNLVCSKCTENIEILFILDCCHSWNMGLPYKLCLDTQRFKLESVSGFVLQSVICLSSSMYNEKSASLQGSGSLFTRHLIDVLREGVLNLTTISKMVKSRTIGSSVDNEQSMVISSSYPIPPLIWMWVTNPRTNIYIHEQTSTLIVERNEA